MALGLLLQEDQGTAAAAAAAAEGLAAAAEEEEGLSALLLLLLLVLPVRAPVLLLCQARHVCTLLRGHCSSKQPSVDMEDEVSRVCWLIWCSSSTVDRRRHGSAICST